MDKNELLELLINNLTLKINREKVESNHHWYNGERRLKVSIEFDGTEIDYGYIDKEDLEFINKSK